LGELSESELRQLYLIVGVRLGIAEGGSSAPRITGKAPNKGLAGKAKVARPAGGAKKSSKGNPSRKSQWETHPLYREYKRLKKVVETQAKERNLSFAAVDSPERTAYNEALSQWLEAKSSFRDHRGPETNSEEGASSKGKEKAVETAGPSRGNAPGPIPSAIGGGQSWADEVQDAMDVESDSSSDEEGEGDNDQAGAVSTAPATAPKRGTRNASLPSRGTPPKKSSGGTSKK